MDKNTRIQQLRSAAYRYDNLITDIEARMPDGSDEFTLVTDDVVSYCRAQMERCNASIAKLRAELHAEMAAEEKQLEAARARAVKQIRDDAVMRGPLHDIFDDEVPSFVSTR